MNCRRERLVSLAALLVGVACLTAPRWAGAATLTVTSLADGGPGTLREALALAAPGDTITTVPGTITLTTGELIVDRDLTIVGPSTGVTISGNGTSRVLRVLAGANVSMSNVTIRDGNATGYAGERWPARSYHASVVFNGRMWVLGGLGASGVPLNDVWYSADGAHWTRAGTADWSPRWGLGAAVFNGRIWVIGGAVGGVYSGVNDVWSSPDGVHWTQEIANAPWVPRYRHGIIVFNGKLWIINGCSQGPIGNEIWSSIDGVNWVHEPTSGSIDGRVQNTHAIHGGELWGVSGQFTNWVARSADGLAWTAVGIAPWSIKLGAAVQEFGGALWIFGGTDWYTWTQQNDAWYSFDGASWFQATANAPWGPREGLTSIVFADRMWIIGGTGNQWEGGQAAGPWFDDVWSSTDGAVWTQAVAGDGDRGGGILNEGVLSLSSAVISNNTAPYDGGGGIANRGQLTIGNSTLSSNLGSGLRQEGGTAIVDATMVAANSSTLGGGILATNQSSLSISNSTIAGNSSSAAGGGIDSDGPMTIVGTSVINNQAVASGGGIAFSGAPVVMSNSTVAGNTTVTNGGGVNQSGGAITATNVTIAGNFAAGYGGGVHGGGDLGTVSLTNSVLAANGTGFQGPNCWGIVSSVNGGYNVYGDPSGCTIASLPADLVGADPMLGAIVDDGTPGRAHLPVLEHSPLIDRGDDAQAPPLDQIGQGRADGDGDALVRSDVGAVEFVPGPATDVTAQVSVVKGAVTLDHATGRYEQTLTITNVSAASIHGPVALVLDALTPGVSLYGQLGVTTVSPPLGSAWLNATMADVAPGASVSKVLEFSNEAKKKIEYTMRVFSGPGPK